MANSVEAVNTKSGASKLVRAGHHQSNYVRGVVGRISALFMADVGEVANIDTTTKDTLTRVMAVCIDCVNAQYKCKLNIADYDFESGKFDRDNAQSVPVVAVAQAVPVMAVADKTLTPVEIFINDQLMNHAQTEEQILAQLVKSGWTKEQLAPFLVSCRPKVSGVPLPPQ